MRIEMENAMALALDNFAVANLSCPSGVASATVTLLTEPADIFVAQAALSEVYTTTSEFGHAASVKSVAFISEVAFSDGGVLAPPNFLSALEFAFATSVTFTLQTDGLSTARAWASLTNYKVV
jgi:hypothetical protein